MKPFFEYHSKLDPFRLFSMEHILTILIIFILCVLLFVFRSQIKRQERFFRFTLVIILLGADVLYHFWLMYENAWSPKSALPLHLSDFAVILAIIMLLTKSYRLFQFMYFAGIGSSIQAILTPDLARFSFPHFQYIEFFVSHGGVVLACLFMIVAYNYEPPMRSLWITVIIVNVYAGCVFLLNKLLGANYMYMMKKPGAASVLDFLGPWPWYLLSLELLMIVSFYLLYSPFWVKRKDKQKDE
ncbi:YwaF family protein [Metabacillus arenae]|uniref:TIGR02206 family membrane protein n=1 Tax=Metabacillus arenae TaxID=2771434 RepID=A0A926NKA3_9BACI|nr:TIGR02206 family membrane protein [Metabacillus arenae]MBD1382320.1 TIGR02206 family membrane protein [Metabacillus arenae]